MKRVWLAELRKKQGFTHTSMAKMLGISRQQYSFIEAGTRNPSLMVALKLSATLSFDPILFLEKGFSDRKQDEHILSAGGN